VHLNALAVRVDRPLLVDGARRGPGVDDAVGRPAKDDPAAAGRERDGVARERLDLHRLEILRHDADAAAARVVAHDAEEVPPLELAHHLGAGDDDAAVVLDAHRLVAPDLLVERVEELLPRRGAGERGAVKERPAEATEIEEPFGRAVEGDTHAVEHEDDPGGGVRHPFDRRLIREEVATIDGLFQVHPRRVPFALRVHARVDPPLRAHRVRALHGDEREQIDRYARLAELDDRHQPGQAAADDDDPANFSRFTARDALCRHFR
jgi:hypothetical protein